MFHEQDAVSLGRFYLSGVPESGQHYCSIPQLVLVDAP